MRKLAFLFILLLSAITVFAAKVDATYVRSVSMNKDVQVVIVTPAECKKNTSVIYLLHGYSGNAKSWIELKPKLPEIADQYNLIFVCPDGKNSWYWDSPNSTYRYETFISKELVEYIDSNYPTNKDRTSRAITGLSMGGHGALWLAFHHKDVFGAAGSTSGGVDIRPFPKNWEMSKQLGEKATNQQVWENHTVINKVYKIKNKELALIIDCGYDDFFFDVNNDLHNKLLKNKIDHDYIVRPGGHDANYWRNSIDYQILFFVNYFRIAGKI